MYILFTNHTTHSFPNTTSRLNFPKITQNICLRLITMTMLSLSSRVRHLGVLSVVLLEDRVFHLTPGRLSRNFAGIFVQSSVSTKSFSCCAHNNDSSVKPLRARHIRNNGRDLHRGPRLIIQIELCRPIDTFSGGGFSNFQVDRRGFLVRARGIVKDGERERVYA